MQHGHVRGYWAGCKCIACRAAAVEYKRQNLAAQPPCVIEGCEGRRGSAAGWCPNHYKRWKKYGDPLGVAPDKPTTPPDLRFWSKVDFSDPDGCWPWKNTTLDFYPTFWVGGHRVKGHRFAYELVHGPITDPTMHVLHRCDNKRCVRPDHLFLGTNADNHLDRHKKGQGSNQYGKTKAVSWGLLEARK